MSCIDKLSISDVIDTIFTFNRGFTVHKDISPFCPGTQEYFFKSPHDLRKKFITEKKNNLDAREILSNALKLIHIPKLTQGGHDVSYSIATPRCSVNDFTQPVNLPSAYEPSSELHPVIDDKDQTVSLESQHRTNPILIFPVGHSTQFENIFFSSDFECANLHRVERTSCYSVLDTADVIDEYNIYLKADPDCSGKGSRQRNEFWFYFRVHCKQGGHTYRFRLHNYSSQLHHFRAGCRPMAFSKRDFKATGVGWRYAGANFEIYRNSLSSDSILSFSLSFEYDDDIVYFAYSQPYSYSQLQSTVYGFLNDAKSSAHLKVAELCRSPGGNRVDLLTITEQSDPMMYPIQHDDFDERASECMKDPLQACEREGSSPDDDAFQYPKVESPALKDNVLESAYVKNIRLRLEEQHRLEEALLRRRQGPWRRKKAIVVVARSRPGDASSSWQCEGLLHFLLSDHQTAKAIRKSFVVLVLPMLSVDGVVTGCSWVDPCGDIAAGWGAPSAEAMPAVYELKKIVRAFGDAGLLAAFLELQGCALGSGSGLLGWVREKDKFEHEARRKRMKYAAYSNKMTDSKICPPQNFTFDSTVIERTLSGRRDRPSSKHCTYKDVTRNSSSNLPSRESSFSSWNDAINDAISSATDESDTEKRIDSMFDVRPVYEDSSVEVVDPLKLAKALHSYTTLISLTACRFGVLRNVVGHGVESSRQSSDGFSYIVAGTYLGATLSYCTQVSGVGERATYADKQLGSKEFLRLGSLLARALGDIFCPGVEESQKLQTRTRKMFNKNEDLTEDLLEVDDLPADTVRVSEEPAEEQDFATPPVEDDEEDSLCQRSCGVNSDEELDPRELNSLWERPWATAGVEGAQLELDDSDELESLDSDDDNEGCNASGTRGKSDIHIGDFRPVESLETSPDMKKHFPKGLKFFHSSRHTSRRLDSKKSHAHGARIETDVERQKRSWISPEKVSREVVRDKWGHIDYAALGIRTLPLKLAKIIYHAGGGSNDLNRVLSGLPENVAELEKQMSIAEEVSEEELQEMLENLEVDASPELKELLQCSAAELGVEIIEDRDTAAEPLAGPAPTAPQAEVRNKSTRFILRPLARQLYIQKVVSEVPSTTCVTATEQVNDVKINSPNNGRKATASSANEVSDSTGTPCAPIESFVLSGSFQWNSPLTCTLADRHLRKSIEATTPLAPVETTLEARLARVQSSEIAENSTHANESLDRASSSISAFTNSACEVFEESASKCRDSDVIVEDYTDSIDESTSSRAITSINLPSVPLTVSLSGSELEDSPPDFLALHSQPSDYSACEENRPVSEIVKDDVEDTEYEAQMHFRCYIVQHNEKQGSQRIIDESDALRSGAGPEVPCDGTDRLLSLSTEDLGERMVVEPPQAEGGKRSARDRSGCSRIAGRRLVSKHNSRSLRNKGIISQTKEQIDSETNHLQQILDLIAIQTPSSVGSTELSQSCKPTLRLSTRPRTRTAGMGTVGSTKSSPKKLSPPAFRFAAFGPSTFSFTESRRDEDSAPSSSSPQPQSENKPLQPMQPTQTTLTATLCNAFGFTNVMASDQSTHRKGRLLVQTNQNEREESRTFSSIIPKPPSIALKSSPLAYQLIQRDITTAIHVLQEKVKEHDTVNKSTLC